MKHVYRMAAEVAPAVVSLNLLKIFNNQLPSVVLDDRDNEQVQCEETILWIDLNIDGISLYKSGNAKQGIPILCRLYGLGSDPEAEKPAVVIPVDMGHVCMVGMYHGMGKPNPHNFLQLLLKELGNLHPNRAAGRMVQDVEYSPYAGTVVASSSASNGRVDVRLAENPLRRRKFAVRVRAIICDGAERPNLKGGLYTYTVLYEGWPNSTRPRLLFVFASIQAGYNTAVCLLQCFELSPNFFFFGDSLELCFQFLEGFQYPPEMALIWHFLKV